MFSHKIWKVLPILHFEECSCIFCISVVSRVNSAKPLKRKLSRSSESLYTDSHYCANPSPHQQSYNKNTLSLPASQDDNSSSKDWSFVENCSQGEIENSAEEPMVIAQGEPMMVGHNVNQIFVITPPEDEGDPPEQMVKLLNKCQDFTKNTAVQGSQGM